MIQIKLQKKKQTENCPKILGTTSLAFDLKNLYFMTILQLLEIMSLKILLQKNNQFSFLFV